MPINFVSDAHMQFLQAGSDIILTNTYQASVDGFRKFLGLSEEESLDLMKRAVTDMARPAVAEYKSTSDCTDSIREV